VRWLKVKEVKKGGGGSLKSPGKEFWNIQGRRCSKRFLNKISRVQGEGKEKKRKGGKKRKEIDEKNGFVWYIQVFETREEKKS